MVVRSLLAALGVVCVTGLLLGWDVDRLVVCWPVSWDVVVAVDIGTWNLLGECVEGQPPSLLTDWWRPGLGKVLG